MFFMIRILATTGLTLSVISLFHYFNLVLGLNEGGSFCNLNAAFNCDLVNQSKWSVIYGTPLAAYGGAFYIFIIFLSFLKNKSLVSKLAFYLSFLSCIFSAFLFYISEFVIGSLCLMCIGMYLVNFCLLLLSYILIKKHPLQSESGIIKCIRINFISLMIILVIALAYLVNISRIAYYVVMKNNDFYQAWISQPEVSFNINDISMLDKDYTKGSSSAPVTIVEFSDLECSACRRFYLAVEDLLPAYKDKIKIVFKNFPLDKSCNDLLQRDMHRTSCYAAVFARCAGEQDKFWNVIDYIFNLDYSNYPENMNLISEELNRSYSLLGLNEEAIKECIVSGRQLLKVKSDIKEGEIMAINSTPSIWINGRKVTVFTPEALSSIFNGIIQEN